jgi:hypothetical protein
MYKKITHTIVEEHFDHPIANQIKKTIERSKVVDDQVFSETTFRSDVHDYFTTYLTNLIEIINSVTGTTDDSVIPFERLFKDAWIDNLGNMTKPLYASMFGETLNEGLRRIVLTTFFLTQNMKNGTEPQFLINGWRNVIVNELSQIMSSFNSEWLFQTVQSIFTAMPDDVVALLKARLKKDSSAEKLAVDKLSSTFATFEKTFVDGIIKQQPERFNKTVTIYNSTNKNDIM